LADVGARYAQALFELADEAGVLAAVEADLKGFRALIGVSADFRRMATSPTISSEDKGKALAAIAEQGKAHALTRNILGLLAANGRVSVLPALATAFEKLAAARRGAVAAEVTSAIKLTAAQQKSIAAALKQAFGKDPEITTTVDPAILGGLKVKVGSRLYDASLKSRLDQLKFALKRA
jgi:F-type H+-transporting ATPase subunit delta